MRRYVKHTLRLALGQLPCGSRVGLGLFTERTTMILFLPVEVCGNFSAIAESIAHIDWRTAWAADSNIAQGLYHTLKLVKGFSTPIVFMTDGQEAPPVNPRYQPDFKELTGETDGARILAAQRPPPTRFEDKPGLVKGLIVGVGGYTLMPIPKFDEQGKPLGVYSMEEVPQASRFGIPLEDPAAIPGYEPRNAPFGSEPAIGNEHLSSVREAYLKELAGQTGLVYHHLESAEALTTALKAEAFAESATVAADIRWLPAAIALLLLSFLHLPRRWAWLVLKKSNRKVTR